MTVAAWENRFIRTLLWLLLWGLQGAFVADAIAQQLPPGGTIPTRFSGGWEPARPEVFHSQPAPTAAVVAAGSQRDDRAAVVQTAYFQTQGQLSDRLPAFPGAAFPGAASPGVGGPAPAPASGLPPYSAPPQAYSGAPPAYSAAPPAVPSLNATPGAAVLPPGVAMGNVAPPPMSAAPAALPTATLPPANSAAAAAPSSDLRSPKSGRLPSGNGLGQSDPYARSAGPAAAPATAPGGPRLDPRQVTTGYPFVTPAPRGKYPTAPYQPAVFQTAYQVPAIPAQLTSTAAVPQNIATPHMASPVTQQTAPAAAPAGAAYLTAAQAALPQYQYSQPGIYPTAYQCAPPVPSFPPTGAVPGNYVPPTLPPNLTPGLYTPNNAGYTPLFSLGQENYNVQLGRGIVGQPTVYVTGQPVRNFMRYLFP